MKWEDVNNPNGSVFLASFADGRVKIFDRRLEEDEAVVRSYSSHSSWVQKVKWHPTIPAQFISARSVDAHCSTTPFAEFRSLSAAWMVKSSCLISGVLTAQHIPGIFSRRVYPRSMFTI